MSLSLNSYERPLVPLLLGDIRHYLAGLLNRYEAGEIDEIPLKACAYVSNILTSTIKDSELEERLQKLEEQLVHEPEGMGGDGSGA